MGAPLEVFPGDLLDLGEASFGEAAQREQKAAHVVPGHPILHVQTFLLGLHEPRGTCRC